MLILGLNKTTLLDYPGHLAATIFTGGCNFRCPYCHNGDLVLRPNEQKAIPFEEIIDHLNKRKGVLEGVCITGGEPTLANDLYDVIAEIKKMGYLVKLDTNGTNPFIIRKLLSEGMLDYVAMDIKTTWDKYPLLTGAMDDEVKAVKETCEILLRGEIDYEFRTTVVKEYISESDICNISDALNGAKAWYIQNYRDAEGVIEKGLHGYSEDELRNIITRVCKTNVYLRGVE